MPLTADQYDALVTAMRQRLNGKRAGRYRRLSEETIRARIDWAMYSADRGGEGQSFGHACDQCGAYCRQLGIQVRQADVDREPKLGTVVVELPVEEAWSAIEPGDRLYRLASGPKTTCPMLDGN